MQDTSVTNLLELAIELNRQGRLDMAESYCRRLLDHTPDHSTARHLLAVILCRKGDLDGGETMLRALLREQPANTQALRHLGDALHTQGRAAEASAVFQALTARCPDDPTSYLSLGISLQAAQRRDQAVNAYLRALDLDDGLALGFFNLGTVLHEMGRLDESVNAYARALELDPNNADAYLNLGNALSDQDRTDEALTFYRLALEIKPDWPDAINNIGLILAARGSLDEAADQFRRAVALDPDNALAHVNLGVDLLRRGEMAAGWTEYEWRWRGGLAGMAPRGFAQPAWQGDDLDGRTVLIHAEQGYGDSVQFARFIPLAARRGGRVVVEAPASLCPLLAKIAGVATIVATGDPLPPFDLHVAMMSLPRVLGLDLDGVGMTAPYLGVNLDRLSHWNDQLGARRDGPVIGIAWAGNPSHKNDRRRSIPAAMLLDRLVQPGRRLISLQKTLRPGDAELLAAHAGQVSALGGDLAGFDDTLALIACLDLVICIDTVVAHLAGAAGKPVWVMLPHVADFRWLQQRDDTPWYPSMRLFRQTTPGDWGDVLDRVAAALGQFHIQANQTPPG